MAGPKQVVCARLEPELLLALKALAAERKMRLSDLIRDAAARMVRPDPDRIVGWGCSHMTITAGVLSGPPSVGCGCTMAPVRAA